MPRIPIMPPRTPIMWKGAHKAIQIMPVVIKRRGSQCIQSAKTCDDETQGSMKYLENGYCRCIINPRRTPEVTYGIRQRHTKSDESSHSHTRVNQRMRRCPEPITSYEIMPFSIPYCTKLPLQEK